MSEPSSAAAPWTTEIQDLLLGYLLGAAAPAWPGADGLTLDEVLRSYPQAAAAHAVPEPDRLLHRYPHLRAELERFFTSMAA
jgi:hypothetical protein